MQNFNISIAKTIINISANYNITKVYCKDFLCKGCGVDEIFLTEDVLNNERLTAQKADKNKEEISALHRMVADILIEKQCIVFQLKCLLPYDAEQKFPLCFYLLFEQLAVHY